MAETQSREASPEAQSLNPLEKAERSALLREIDLHHGNISRVASEAGHRAQYALPQDAPPRHRVSGEAVGPPLIYGRNCVRQFRGQRLIALEVVVR